MVQVAYDQYFWRKAMLKQILVVALLAAVTFPAVSFASDREDDVHSPARRGFLILGW